MKYLKRNWQRLHGRLQIHFNHVLLRLQDMLYRATDMVDALIEVKKESSAARTGILTLSSAMSKEGKLRRGSFAFNQKDALDKIITELKNWHQDMFGPSWFQLLRIPGKLLAETAKDQTVASAPVAELRQIRKTIESANDNIDSAVQNMLLPTGVIQDFKIRIFGSSAAMSKQRDSGRSVIIDTITVPSDTDKQGTVENFCSLAQKLASTETSLMRMLQCWGVVDGSDTAAQDNHILLLFHLPHGLATPRSLREILMERSDFLALERRLDLAVQLAQSITFIHSLGIVHKNIRPETILVFHSDSDHTDKAFVLGFEQFRHIQTHSLLRGDLEWRKAIYRHPSRHGLHPERGYIMQDDIYSLGVCLLELGLWRSFIFNVGGSCTPHPEVDVSKISGKETWRKAHILKEKFESLAQTELPAKMGRRYSEVVYSCLSCLNRGNTDFGDEEDFEDDDDILVGVRYLEKVECFLLSLP